MFRCHAISVHIDTPKVIGLGGIEMSSQGCNDHCGVGGGVGACGGGDAVCSMYVGMTGGQPAAPQLAK